MQQAHLDGEDRSLLDDEFLWKFVQVSLPIFRDDHQVLDSNAAYFGVIKPMFDGNHVTWSEFSSRRPKIRRLMDTQSHAVTAECDEPGLRGVIASERRKPGRPEHLAGRFVSCRAGRPSINLIEGRPLCLKG